LEWVEFIFLSNLRTSGMILAKMLDAITTPTPMPMRNSSKAVPNLLIG
jgi:hypothetical protein